MEKAAVAWCILNRVDSPRFPSTVALVVTPSQFHGYSRNNPVEDELVLIAQDVLGRWQLEKLGLGDVGRVLPPDYLYFGGSTGRNRFRRHHRSQYYWDWSLPNPYYVEVIDEP